jgi:metal-responsive CopG/Arc/MetJ family transcriptional regulator
MKRTTVSLPEELQADLEEVAREEGKSQETLILEGIRLVLGSRGAPPKDQGEVLDEIHRQRSFSPAAAGAPGSTTLLREDRDR